MAHWYYPKLVHQGRVSCDDVYLNLPEDRSYVRVRLYSGKAVSGMFQGHARVVVCGDLSVVPVWRVKQWRYLPRLRG